MSNKLIHCPQQSCQSSRTWTSEKYKYDEAVEDDVDLLLENIRPIDWYECVASVGHTDLNRSLKHALRVSDHAVKATYDGELLALFGVYKTAMSPGAVIWMLATNEITKHKRRFLFDSEVIIDQYQHLYGRLYNYVSAKNTMAIRWLKWLGFEIYEPKPFGPFGKMFRYFVR